MFGKKFSQADYDELEQKCLTFECAYNNEHARCDDLENKVRELTDRIKTIQEYGNAAPEELAKRAEEAENRSVELIRLLEIEKDRNAGFTAKLKAIGGGNNMADNNQATQWEYKTLDTWSGDKEIETKLGQLGENGWEQSGQITSGGGSTSKLLFKRPKQTRDYGYSR